MGALSHLNKYLFQYRWPLLLGLVYLFGNNLFGSLQGPIIRESVDLIAEAFKKGNLLSALQGPLLLQVGYLFGAVMISGAFLYIQRKTLIGVSRKIEYDLKNEVYQHYQSLPLSFYKKNQTGDLMNRISEDVNHVRNYLGPGIMYGLNLFALFTVTIPLMLSVNLKLTMYSLLPLPFLVLSIYLVHQAMTRRSEEIQRSLSQLSSDVQETFTGLRILKSYGRIKDYETKFAHASGDYRKKNLALTRINALFGPTILFLIGASNILILWIGGQEVIKGTITIGNITEFFFYLNKLTWPVASLGWITSLIRRAEVSQVRINEFLHEKSDILSGTEKPNTINGSLRFDKVSFTYPDTGIKAVQELSFEVKPGERLAIIGGTGSGKSTITHLIGRLFDPSSGAIYMDNTPLSSYHLQSLRSHIGYVPQDVQLFSDSIKNNIAFGKTEATDQEIEEAARNADLLENIKGFPKGWDTIIGERGVTLSGGQKQRLSLARALIRKPRILLLDDCLSAVDTRTEDTIIQNLNAVADRQTCIIVSHRVSSVRMADRIIVIDDGRLVQEGRHQELIEIEGPYRKLFLQQTEQDNALMA